MTQLAEVHTLYETNASDIAAMARQFADSIDEGAKPKNALLVTTEDDGSMQIFGWGAIDSLQAIAMLNIAATKMQRDALDSMEGDE